MTTFRLVPLCANQLKDVSKQDIIENGLYRKCNVYKGGGGYDQFPYICEKRLGRKYNNQFVAQLYGCPLKCPYCYVTPDGIFGDFVVVGSEDMLDAFDKSGQSIFHLMGGAPALYLRDWPSIINNLDNDKVFHSDFLLIERLYTEDELLAIRKENTLYAVSVKGYGDQFLRNTGVALNTELFWENFTRLHTVGINFYVTFTGMSTEEIESFKVISKDYGLPPSVFEDSFHIDIIRYKALEV